MRLPSTGSETGSTALQTAVLAPVLLMLLTMGIAAGRVGQAHAAIETAAAQAARAASIARGPATAQAEARDAAMQTLSSAGISCPPQVRTDTSGFSLPAGTAAVVRTSITCTVPLSDLLVPGLGGSRTLSADAVSALDTYRERR